jgi:N-acetylglucosaminyl-diphospho-decaprenol L-rhamnosyltransferase
VNSLLRVKGHSGAASRTIGGHLAGLDLAVVVVSWNVRDLLIDCLSSARAAIAAAGLTGEIWVVDNASGDGSPEAVRARFGADPDLRLIASPVNLWFGGGQNLALRLMGFGGAPLSAAGEEVARSWGDPLRSDRQGELPRYVLVLNPDTLVRPDAVGQMVTFMDAHPRVGVCGPRLVYGDGRFQHAAYRFPSLSQVFLDFWPLNWRLTSSRLNGRYARRLYETGEPFEIDHPLGAAMLFRRATIEQTGGFCLDYRMYVEEIDWCVRAKRAGWDVYCVPAAEIVHYEGQSTRQVRPQMVVALWRSRFLLFDRFYSRAFRWAVQRVVRAGMKTRADQAQAALERGELTAADAAALVDAYRTVIADARGEG